MMIAESPQPAIAAEKALPRSTFRGRALPLQSTAVVAVLGLMLMAGAVRGAGLRGPDGTMGGDESTQALAAAGVAQTGLPVMPSGRLYTRGLLNSYAMAPSLAALGPHDFAARLPSALAGVLLVPVTFLLGRSVGGCAVGFAAASFTVVSEPLIEWSLNARFPSLFLLLFMLSVYCCYQGFIRGRGRWQVVGTGCFSLALLSYEFGVVLPVWLAVYLGLRAAKGDREWYRGRSTVLALALLLGAFVLFGLLTLASRSATLAGPLSEARRFFSPGLSLTGVAFYVSSLLSDYYILIAVALAGLPLLAREQSRATIYLSGLLLLVFLLPSLVIQVKREVRYVLPMLPLLAILAAAGTVHLARLLAVRLHTFTTIRVALPYLALLAVFAGALFGDVKAVVAQLQQRPRTTWLEVLQRHGLQPTDILVTRNKEISYFYLGRTEYYFYGRGGKGDDFERYAYQASDAVRSAYTNSILLHKRGDFKRLLEAPNRGRVLWVIGNKWPELRDEVEDVERGLWSSLVASANLVDMTPDAWVLLRLTLPRSKL
jgi:hypothetical protein